MHATRPWAGDASPSIEEAWSGKEFRGSHFEDRHGRRPADYAANC